MLYVNSLKNLKTMNNFPDQLDQNLQNDIATFNSEAKYEKIRKLYKDNFAKIVELIDEFNPKGAIEDISNLDDSLSTLINSEILLLKEINRAIKELKLLKQDIL